MKKLVFIIILFTIFANNIYAYNREKVVLNKCIDGDTASFIYNNKIIKARFLAIDTPETKHPKKGIEPFGIEASEYTCNELKNANTIEIEFDSKADIKDKYERYLVWVFVDDNLLQEKLIKKGFAKVAYIYDEYKYVNLLREKELHAKNNKLGIWSNLNKNIYIYIIIICIIIILFIFSPKFRIKVLKKIKKYIIKKTT